ncbi:hypothetical protein E4U28_004371, partial [Claviceps purpurea]
MNGRRDGFRLDDLQLCKTWTDMDMGCHGAFLSAVRKAKTLAFPLIFEPPPPCLHPPAPSWVPTSISKWA